MPLENAPKLKESIIQTKVRKYFERKKWLVVKILQCTKNGWPDLQCHKDGKTIFIETKTEGGRLRPLQFYRQHELREQGFEVYTIYHINDLNNVQIS